MISVKYYRTTDHSQKNSVTREFNNEKEMIEFGIQENEGNEVIISKPDGESYDYEMEIYDDYRE